MFPKIDPTKTTAWKELQKHFAEARATQIKELFLHDKDRFKKYSLSFGDIVFDYSKNIITEQTLRLLFQLAKECRVDEAKAAMFNGEKINETENRSVLHTALRNFSSKPVISDGTDVMPLVRKVQEHMRAFCK